MFECSICAESSQTICVYCTKDACENHLCERCHRCSDCCTCDMTVREENGHAIHQHEFHQALPAFQPSDEVFTTQVITDVRDEAVEEAILDNMNGTGHAS